MSMETSGGAGAVHPILGGGGGGRRGLPRWIWLAVLTVLLLHAALVLLLSRMGLIQTPLTPTPEEPSLVLVSPSPPPPPPTPVRQPHARTQQVETVHSTPFPPMNTRTIEIPASSQPPIEGPKTIAEPPKAPPQTETKPEPPPVISEPHWLSQPSAAEMARFYPSPALENNVEGRAVIRCLVTVAGTLTACTIVQEQPRGYGFGRAAIQLSQYFRMTPKAEDGRPVGGASVEVAIRFRL
jgi:protein TonB